MARYETAKSTNRGKCTTCSRKQTRRVKFATPALDTLALERELHRSAA